MHGALRRTLRGSLWRCTRARACAPRRPGRPPRPILGRRSRGPRPTLRDTPPSHHPIAWRALGRGSHTIGPCTRPRTWPRVAEALRRRGGRGRGRGTLRRPRGPRLRWRQHGRGLQKRRLALHWHPHPLAPLRRSHSPGRCGGWCGGGRRRRARDRRRHGRWRRPCGGRRCRHRWWHGCCCRWSCRWWCCHRRCGRWHYRWCRGRSRGQPCARPATGSYAGTRPTGTELIARHERGAGAPLHGGCRGRRTALTVPLPLLRDGP